MYRIFPLIVFLSTLFVLADLSAQESFERRYPTTTSDVLTSDMIRDGAYAICGVEVNLEGERRNVNFTTFTSKGDQKVSRAIFFGDSSEVVHVTEVGNLIKLENGAFTLCANIEKDSLNKMIVTLDKEGNIIWSVRTGTVRDRLGDVTYDPVVVQAENGRVFHISNVTDAGNRTDLMLTILADTTGRIISKRKIAITPNNDEVTERVIKMKNGADGLIMMLSTTDREEDGLMMSKLDTLGNVLWTKSYTIDNAANALDQTGYDLIQLKDETWAVIGSSTAKTATERNGALLIHMDNNGTPLLTERMSPLSNRYNVYPQGIVGTLDTTVIVGAIRHDMTTDTYEPFVFSYNLDSIFGYQTLLDTAVSADPSYTALITVDSLSATMMTLTKVGERSYPNISKVDESGLTMCENKESILGQDTAIVTVVDVLSNVVDRDIFKDSIGIESMVFGDFAPPILNLQDTVYCPADPINYFVDATVRGAVSYLWNDGKADSTRTFTEEGMYSVTVTVREDICFRLCDTLTITKLGTPEVTIDKNLDFICQQDIITLIAQGSGSAITEYLWSDGSTNSSLSVPDRPGEYGVTVIDACGEMASATTTITEADLPSTSGQITLDCGGVLRVSGVYTSVEWDNGELSETITITEPGEYSVDLLDVCNDVSQTLTIDVSSDDLPSSDLSGDVAVSIPCGSMTQAMLTASGTGYDEIRWSTGETGEQITVSSGGTYTATFVGESYLDGQCTNELPIPSTIDQESLDNNSGCLIWPNAFQPEDNDPDNKRFGPKILDMCDQNITNYELKVFNRWGKAIFTSTDVAVGWNGSAGSDEQPGGVYMYWVRYNNGGMMCERRGDVTLIR